MIVLDTHVLVWVVDGSRRLGATARDRVNQAARAGGVGLSAITPWEVALLAEKGRLRLGRDVAAWLDEALALPGLRLIPIDPIAVASVGLPGDLGADPADRFIVATARHFGVPLVTADRAILAYGLQGHVRVLDARR